MANALQKVSERCQRLSSAIKRVEAGDGHVTFDCRYVAKLLGDVAVGD